MEILAIHVYAHRVAADSFVDSAIFPLDSPLFAFLIKFPLVNRSENYIQCV